MVRVAVALVNLLTPGEDRGRGYQPPEADERTAAVGAVLRASGGREATWEEAAELCFVAAELREVFEAVSTGAIDDAAARVNAASKSLPDGWAAGCATGLAVVLGGDLHDRLGVCTAPRCDRVYVDISRNGTRRYCSTSCQNRVKTAAFRARLT